MPTPANALDITAAGLVKFDGTSAFSGVTLTNHAPLVGGASNGITSLGPLTNGQLVIGSTGADPVAASLTAGTGITITPGAGSISIAATGTSFTWVDVTGTTQAMAVNTGYIADNAALVTLTLPSTAALGDKVIVMGKGAGGWKIAQNSGQVVNVGSVASTSGVGGSLASTNQWDNIELICVTANTTWSARPPQGNITIV